MNIYIKLGKLSMDFCSRIQQLSLNKDMAEDSSSMATLQMVAGIFRAATLSPDNETLRRKI